MNILFFNQISKKDLQLAGGKGANLGEMTRAGIQVPDGFVVLSIVFENFLEKAGIEKKIMETIKKIDLKNSESIKISSDRIKELIQESKTTNEVEKSIFEAFEKLDSEFVAVRSSATAEDSATDSWAGQLDTFLEVTKGDLIESIKNCWVSLFSERALFYRIEKKCLSKKFQWQLLYKKWLSLKFQVFVLLFVQFQKMRIN